MSSMNIIQTISAISKRKLVYGIGIYDSDHKTKASQTPYYQRWSGMLSRCY